MGASQGPPHTRARPQTPVVRSCYACSHGSYVCCGRRRGRNSAGPLHVHVRATLHTHSGQPATARPCLKGTAVMSHRRTLFRAITPLLAVALGNRTASVPGARRPLGRCARRHFAPHSTRQPHHLRELKDADRARYTCTRSAVRIGLCRSGRHRYSPNCPTTHRSNRSWDRQGVSGRVSAADAGAWRDVGLCSHLHCLGRDRA